MSSATPTAMPPVKLHLILARASNGVIGHSNTLPWHLPEDMAHFKRTTMGCPVIMGRKTWDSLPPKFRPLPGRLNVVVTHQPDWQASGALRAGSVAQALQLCSQHAQEEGAMVNHTQVDCTPVKNAWVIGGAQIYAQALPLAHSAVVTEIEQAFEGDAFAPTFGPDWAETARERHTAANGLAYSFVTYTRSAGV
jgi:dihydrofolate reductase